MKDFSLDFDPTTESYTDMSFDSILSQYKLESYRDEPSGSDDSGYSSLYDDEDDDVRVYTPGAAFLNVLSPCPRGWRYPAADIAAVVKAAVDSCVWPLFEVVEGVYHLTYEPREKLPVADYMRMQGRFAHCFKPGNEWMLDQAQQWVDQQWNALLEKCE